ncbi:MAG TPA: hypothetical protein VH394_01510 [Thermoanaerobaculia bacterium]|jgi:hypothetical protein|nr:hypothetical protein [Thermoanaerobaculia bacterium]
MATSVKDLTMDDLREMIEKTVRRTLEEYLDDLRLLLPAISKPPERDDPRPLADRPLKPSLDH